MNIDSDVLATLLHMQELDVQVIRTNKKLEDMPERKVILQSMAKKRAVQEKSEQVEAMASKAEAKLARVSGEDDELKEKAARIQAEIDEVKGDFRSVEARTKELSGVQKRREALEEDMRAIDAELEKINAVRAQIKAIDEQLDAAEQKAKATFVEEGGRLTQQVADVQKQRAGLAATVPADVLKIYERTSGATGGVPLALLGEGDCCGACRTPIDHGRIVDMRSQGNVGTCPNCGRMLILKTH